jgi:O-antigen ligase
MAKWFWQTAIVVFWVLSFVLVSRILDVAHGFFRLPAILLGLLAVTLVVSRRCFVFWRTTAGKIMPFFAAWVILAFFVSPRGPQSTFFLQSLITGALLFTAAAGLLATTPEFRKWFGVVAAAGLVAGSMGIVWGSVGNGRLALRGGAYADPNYYAMWLLAVTPLIWTAVARRALWTQLLGGAASALPLFVFIKTGSRAGVVGLGVMALVLFILGTLRTRILIATIAAMAAVAVVAFVPAVVSRLIPSSQRGADSDSARARQTLLETSLAVTLGSPLFGVGPGNFAFFVAEEGRSRGVEWAPMNTHNAYTQVSSETGIPGLLLFVLLIAFSLRNAISLYRQSGPKGLTPDEEIRLLTRGFLLSLTGILTCVFFLSEGYNMMVLLWLGIAAGLRQLLPEPQAEEMVEEVVYPSP